MPMANCCKDESDQSFPRRMLDEAKLTDEELKAISTKAVPSSQWMFPGIKRIAVDAAAYIRETKVTEFRATHALLKRAVNFALSCAEGTQRDYSGELIGLLQLAMDCDDGITHASDCALHNEPAYPIQSCNCGVRPKTL